MPLVPTSVTTVMSTVPAAATEGVNTLIWDALTTLKQPVMEEGHGYGLVTGTSTGPIPLPLKITSEVVKPWPVKLVPPMVTTSPPFCAPSRCERAVTVGNVAP